MGQLVRSLRGDGICSVVGKRDIPEQRSPVKFDQFRPVGRAGQGRRGWNHHLANLVGRRRRAAKLHTIAPFKMESFSPERTVLGAGPARNHVFKGGESASINRVPEGQEGGRINQADPILQDALRVGARFVRIERFVAIGRVRRHGNLRFFDRRLDATGIELSNPRIGPYGWRRDFLHHREFGILSGGNGGFAQDGPAGESGADLPQKFSAGCSH